MAPHSPNAGLEQGGGGARREICAKNARVALSSSEIWPYFSLT